MPYDAIVESSTPDLTPASVSISTVADIVTWPWPRIIPTKFHVFGFFVQSNLHLYMFEMNLNTYSNWEGYVVGDLGLASNVDEISIADFGSFYILSFLGTDLIPYTFLRDPLLINGVSDRDITGINFISSFNLPAFATCCNYNGQFIGGNIYSTSVDASNIWLNFSTNSVVWSGIGSFELNPTVDSTAGYKHLLNTMSFGSEKCTVYKILPLQEAGIIYTNHGLVAFVHESVQNIFTFAEVPLNGLGISSGNHIAGNNYIHGFIDEHKDFWTLENSTFRALDQNGGKLTKRGYRDDISSLFTAATPVIINFLPRWNTFYISNGLKTIVINQFGAYTTHQAVSGIIQGFDDKLYGTYFSSSDTVGRIVLDTEDFSQRGIKSLESLLVGISHASGTKITYGTDYRINKTSSFKRSLLKRGNPSGESRIGISAVEFRPVVIFDTYTGNEFSSLSVNVKFPDIRYRRTLLGTGANTQ